MTRSTPPAENNLLQCFPPVASAEARVLILGSMPGERSLQTGEYYAHPRNQFWPIIESVLGIPATLPYDRRCRLLAGKGVALWDVIGRCARRGSLDSAIRNDSLMPNDFREFFAAHPRIAQVFFNGLKAEEVFRRRVMPTLGEVAQRLDCTRLPSTSPANATWSAEKKRKAWQAVADALHRADSASDRCQG